ncbi:hypothetical protein [Ciceribacter selenitireducens]
MLKFFFGRQQSRGVWKRADDDWSRDPLAHPAIAAMSARELADLPLVPPPSDGRDCQAVSRKSPRAGKAMGTDRTVR